MPGSRSILQIVQSRFIKDLELVPLLGAELEFYAIDVPVEVMSDAVGYPIFEERGCSQYEVKLPFCDDALVLADSIDGLKKQLLASIKDCDGKMVFSSKPFEDQPGSSLHIHVNLRDKEGKFPFEKQGDGESSMLCHAVGGLLSTMNEAMHYFAPRDTDLARYTQGKEVPGTVSWGGNNRTVALRLPTVPVGQRNARRIEHRVPCSDADPYLVIACILEGVRLGLVHALEPLTPKIYGDAWQSQYDLPYLTRSDVPMALV